MKRVSYKNYSSQYKNISSKDMRSGKYPCFYCGVLATQVDHFIPQAFTKSVKFFVECSLNSQRMVDEILIKQKLIPCCGECNRLASDGLFNTPDEKKRFIKAKLFKRYFKILELPNWSKEEIEELDYNLQSAVNAGLNDRKTIRERLNW